MRKTISLLMLFTSIAGSVCAQSNNASDRAFEVPDNIIMNRRFFVSLESGNKMQIEVSDISDLDRMQNIDSLLQVFLADILPLKDSLADPLTAKRIDYVTDAQNRKKIRFQQSFAKGASFLVNKGELSSLRTEQDTISLIGIIADPFKPKEKVSLTNPRYYHFTFYLNNIGELNGYINSGLLKEKIETIHNSVNTKWPLILGGSSHYLKNDKSISADKPKGFTANRTSDYLTGFITVNGGKLQTLFCAFLKHWAKVHFFKPRKNLQMGTRVLWEPHYLFAKDNQNKLRTYRNDFLTLTYAQGGTRDHDPRKDFSFSAAFSAGYLIHRSGDFFDKNTFRLGAGKIQLYKTGIEPSIFFNNFFKGVTPGIKITQSF